MSKNGLIFFLGPPRTGGYAYYPVPSAPIEDLRPIGKIWVEYIQSDNLE